jgi:ATP-dependent Clp protease ATP-binding subunit ClpB
MSINSIRHIQYIPFTFVSENIKKFSNPQIKKILAVVALALCGLIIFSRYCNEIKNRKIQKMKDAEIQQKKNDQNQGFNLDALDKLEDKLATKILGQPYAIKVTVEALMRHAAGMRNSKFPIGTFLYVGPTGVGKTQLAKELALELFGDEKRLIRIDMAAFKEEHSLTRLIGALPGYKDHKKGGQLTEALKMGSHSVVLLDEIDKANPNVLKIFLQVFDEGFICDAQGNVIDCRNTIFILTSNLASKKILDLSKMGETGETILNNIKPDIIRFISPELYNRLEIAPFLGLGEEQLDELIKNMLKELEKDLFEKKQITIDWDSNIVDFVKDNGYDYELGARPLKRMLEKNVSTVIAQEIVGKRIQSGDSIRVYLANDKILVEKKM